MEHETEHMPEMRLVFKDDRTHLEIKRGGYYFTPRDLTEKDAKAIYIACNAHEELVALLTEIQGDLLAGTPSKWISVQGTKRIDAVLNKARGEA